MINKNLFPMNLQLFADAGADGGEPGGTGNTGNASGDGGHDGGDGHQGGEPAERLRYTDAQVDEIVKQKKAAWAKEMEAKATEAQRLGQMSEAEKQQELLKQERERAENFEKEINSYKMRDTARGLFDEAGVSVTDADLDLIVTPDADSTKANVSKFIEFATRVKRDVEKEFLSGDHIAANGNSLKNTGSRGAELAKNVVSTQTRDNPYFKS